MQILVQNNRVVDYCSENSYICFGNFVTCENKQKTFYDVTVVTVEDVELPSDIDSSEYLYIEGSFIRVGAKVVTKVNGIPPVDGNVELPLAPVSSVNGKTGDVIVDLPVGHMYFSIEKTVPAGRLPASGALYNRTLYQDLYNWADEHGLIKSESEWQAIASANNGNCAYYSSGDESTTFRVPCIKSWVKGASSIDEVGSYLKAGLPNISGSFGAHVDLGRVRAAESSALFTSRSGIYYQGTTNHNGATDLNVVNIDASRSNPIYGNADTVQPPSIVGQWLIVAFGVTHNIGEADVADVMSAVEQVQTSVDTIEQGVGTAIDYIIESYRDGYSWYEVYKSGKVRQGGSETRTIDKIVTFLKPFANDRYLVTIGYYDDESPGAIIQWRDKTTTTVRFQGNYPATIDWIAEG